MTLKQQRALPWNTIKLIVSDMDGTLLGIDKTLSTQVRAAYKSARQAGLLATFATGRIHTMTDAYIQALELNCPVVTTNGGVIVNPWREVLYARTLALEDVAPLLEYCRAEKLDYCALTFSGGWFAPESRRRLRFEQYNDIAHRMGRTPIPLHTFPQTGDVHSVLTGQTISKLLIYERNPETYHRCWKRIQTYPALACVSSEEALLDVMAAGVSKGSGVAELCRIVGVLPEETCVFGDYYNDIPMFTQAGIAVAMGNAPEDVRRQADYVCPPNTQDGVAQTIFQHILSRL